jgi:hypothetical protein
MPVANAAGAANEAPKDPSEKTAMDVERIPFEHPQPALRALAAAIKA